MPLVLKEVAERDLALVKKLLQRVETTIHDQPNRVRYGMNRFLIAVGIYIESLTNAVLKATDRIGKVSVDMGKTACKVPYGPEYIAKARKRGNIGIKRKSVRC